MTKVKQLNEAGLVRFLQSLKHGDTAAVLSIASCQEFTEPFGDCEIDTTKIFGSRYELGVYLCNQLKNVPFNELMSPSSDGLWAWLALIYFPQLTEKGVRREEHYVVTRKGSAGSLAYRHAVRTSFELVYIHGQSAWICLRGPMHTFGELTEQLASRQTLARNLGFFNTAYELYVKDGKLLKGASSKPKKPKERAAGDKSGLGSARRLAVALQRLDLTYDTELMDPVDMRKVLPREFNIFISKR